MRAATTAAKGGRGAKGNAEVGYIVIQPTRCRYHRARRRTNAFQSSEFRPHVSGIIAVAFHRRVVRQEGHPSTRSRQPLSGRHQPASANPGQRASARRQAARVKATATCPLAAIRPVSAHDLPTPPPPRAPRAPRSTRTRRGSIPRGSTSNSHTVPAPISGKVCSSLFTEGALSRPTTDPLAVDIDARPDVRRYPASSTDLLKLRRALLPWRRDPCQRGGPPQLEDGSDYGFTGTANFSEAMVDTATGTVTLRRGLRQSAGAVACPACFVPPASRRRPTRTPS